MHRTAHNSPVRSSGLTAQPLAARRPSARGVLFLGGNEAVNVFLALRDYGKSLSYKFVCYSNDSDFTRLAIGTKTVKASFALRVTAQGRESGNIELTA